MPTQQWIGFVQAVLSCGESLARLSQGHLSGHRRDLGCAR
jgi:hypothetical protein